MLSAVGECVASYIITGTEAATASDTAATSTDTAATAAASAAATAATTSKFIFE